MIAGTPILSVAAIKDAEHALFAQGVDPFALMRTAGEAAANAIISTYEPQQTLVLCGPGNNGGDGYVIAHALAQHGWPVQVAAVGAPRTASAQQAAALWGSSVAAITDVTPAPLLIDALFGIGLTRGLDDALAARLRSLGEAAHHVVAIDVPSGVESDTGALLSVPPDIDLCLALGALKPAHVIGPASFLISEMRCLDIGLSLVDTAMRVLETPRIRPPGPNDHKYSRGMVAVVAGSMPGAIALAAEAAARSGAGYVRIIGPVVDPRLPRAVVVDPDHEALTDPRIAAILIGPGLGRGADAHDLLLRALALGCPVVIDADALRILRQALNGARLPAGCVLTPHSGEFDDLFGTGGGGKIDRTVAAAREIGAVVVHKGADTVIAAPDGRVRVAVGASPWLSTAGTGDVLAGIVAGRVAVTHDPFRAACEGVWLHQRSARHAGPGCIADDLLRHMGAAMEDAL